MTLCHDITGLAKRKVACHSVVAIGNQTTVRRHIGVRENIPTLFRNELAVRGIGQCLATKRQLIEGGQTAVGVDELTVDRRIGLHGKRTFIGHGTVENRFTGTGQIELTAIGQFGHALGIGKGRHIENGVSHDFAGTVDQLQVVERILTLDGLEGALVLNSERAEMTLDIRNTLIAQFKDGVHSLHRHLTLSVVDQLDAILFAGQHKRLAVLHHHFGCLSDIHEADIEIEEKRVLANGRTGRTDNKLVSAHTIGVRLIHIGHVGEDKPRRVEFGIRLLFGLQIGKGLMVKIVVARCRVSDLASKHNVHILATEDFAELFVGGCHSIQIHIFVSQHKRSTGVADRQILSEAFFKRSHILGTEHRGRKLVRLTRIHGKEVLRHRDEEAAHVRREHTTIQRE